jgi:ABC-type transport system involved in multi-copper enzyme maturation permease subunit
VLTLFLLWPLLLACVMVSAYWPNLLSVGAYLAIVLLTCLTTAITALFCSVLFKKSSQAMMTTYLVIILLFCGPLAATFFAQSFFPEHPATPIVKQVGMVSPFATAFSIPLEIDTDDQSLDQMGRPRVPQRDWSLFGGFVLVNSLQNGALLVTMIWLFNTRWRVAD